jgi:sporulation integral membrane protein YtvI
MTRELYKKYNKPFLKLLLIICVFLIIYVSVKYLVPFFAPFVIALIISLINEPVIRVLENKVKIPRKIAAIISLLLTISVLGVIVTLGIIKIFNELVILQGNLSTYIDSISGQIADFSHKLNSYYNNLPPNIILTIDASIQNLSSNLEGIITYIVSYIVDTITSIPRLAVFIIATLLSTYFISSDRDRILSFLRKQLPDTWAKNFYGIKTGTATALLGYFKAILILMLITFIETTIGLLIIRSDYVLVMGVVVALADAVPVLGTGIVMVPWITWNLITGNIEFAIPLSIIFILGVMTRQILEPKIIGHHIGLHPLITLVSMYIGLSLFGFLGLFIGPISIILVKNLQHSGLIHIWKE